MSRHVTYRGVTLDMDSLRRENEKVPAMGNMKVNAKGDQIKGGLVTKTADQIARDNHRVQSAIINSSLKGPIPSMPVIEAPKTKTKIKEEKVMKEVELPSGDIMIEEDKSGS
ncbi:MAG TPA: hypothetical protein VIY47_09225 [Ignavibacteriaceae bacterium]